MAAKLCQTTDYSHNSPLHVAAARGNLEVVDMLLKVGARIKARNELSQTPAHLAAKAGHVS